MRRAYRARNVRDLDEVILSAQFEVSEDKYHPSREAGDAQENQRVGSLSAFVENNLAYFVYEVIDLVEEYVPLPPGRLDLEPFLGDRESQSVA